VDRNVTSSASTSTASASTPPAHPDIPSWRFELPPEKAAAAIDEAARDWIERPALARISACFDGPVPQFSPQGLADLERWSAERLDTRAGRERHEAPPVHLTPAQTTALTAAAPVLGLDRTAPPQRPTYACTVILGGTLTANRMRSLYVQEQRTRGTRTGLLVALGTARPLTETERRENPSTDCESEAEDLAAVVSQTFAPLDQALPRERGGQGTAAWFEERRQGPGIELWVQSAPSTRPGARADTADCLAFLCSRLSPAHLTDLLLVTSAVYAPYTAFTAAPVLARAGVSTFEVVGTPSAAPTDRPRRAQYLAQEVHSTLRAISRALASPSTYASISRPD
jgi:hypothetical protein